MKKHKQRKLSTEKLLSINRKLILKQGNDRRHEYEYLQVETDDNGRGVIIDVILHGDTIF